MANDNNKNKRSGWITALSYVIIPVLVVLVIAFMLPGSGNDKDMKYYEVIQLFDDGDVAEYSLNLSSGKLKYKLRNEEDTKTYSVPSVSLFVEDVHKSVVDYNRKNPDSQIKYNYIAGSSNSWITSILPLFLLTVGLVVFMYIMFKRMGQNISNETTRTLNFGKARISLGKDSKKKKTFDDVAGADEEKEELQEIVEFLREPKKFSELGARIPKGVLLVGPPGTGKTLIARAVAGEADVPFFSISGSDFVEMYVGVGASRVRDLFAQAKKNSPSIIFIDEIDAVGRHRGAGMGGGHDEREQTLNQMLVEMDGFGENEGVIVIAATNRPDILDPALLRPGRFDRQVTVTAPDVKGREAILKVHAKGKPLAADVDLSVIAKSTAGFTGADLENLLNEAALLAARRSKKAITMSEIEEATIKIVVGTEKKSRKISDKEKKLTAFHEAGHAVATFHLEGQDPVHQISIIPRGMAGGYTMSLPAEDKSYRSKNEILDDIVVLMGGRVAEALVLGDISTGASNDIERATETARKMVTKYGMSEKIGPVSFGSSNEEIFLGRDYSHTRNYSETVAALIDEEVDGIVKNAYSRCSTILSDNMEQLHRVADYLIEHEKMDGELFKMIMNGELPPEPEKAPELAESGEATASDAANDSSDNTADSGDESES